MPLRLTSPTVGLSPASPFAEEGQTTDPSVSVPTPANARFAETAAPVPELGSARSGRAHKDYESVRAALHPLLEWLDECWPTREIGLPGSRHRPYATARRGVGWWARPSIASDPRRLIMRSEVSILSLMSTECHEAPTRPFDLRSWSSASAIWRSLGVSSMTALTIGPACRSPQCVPGISRSGSVKNSGRTEKLLKIVNRDLVELESFLSLSTFWAPGAGAGTGSATRADPSAG